MSYTTLRVGPSGVYLYERHRRRLDEGSVALESGVFERFASAALEGIYALEQTPEGLRVSRRCSSRLHDGIELATAASPVVQLEGPQPKQGSPSPWDLVRKPGIEALLTNADGTEVYESSAASVLAWDGELLVAAPLNRPRVASLAERHFLDHRAHRRAPIFIESRWPIILVNAVVGVCVPHLEGRDAFPEHVVRELRETFEASARRAPRVGDTR
jgi:hypothetical protein